MILLGDHLPGHLPVGSGSFKSYCSAKRSGLSDRSFYEPCNLCSEWESGSILVFIFPLTSKRKEKAILFIRFAFF